MKNDINYVVYLVKLKEFDSTGSNVTKTLFSSKIFCKMNTVALSFVFDKYCLIID